MLQKKLVGLFSLVFVSIFSLYLLTLGPSFQPDDSPETIASFVNLTPQHPPGYPLHTLLGRLFELGVVGNTAFQANLLSAILGSLGVLLLVALLFLAIRGDFPEPFREDHRALALWSSLLSAGFSLAFSKTYWSQSLTAKGGVYLLQICLLLGILLLLSRRPLFAKNPTRSPAATWGFFAFLLALGFTTSWETQLLFFTAMVSARLIAAFSNPGLFRISGKSLLSAVTFLMLGLTPYLLLILHPTL